MWPVTLYVAATLPAAADGVVGRRSLLTRGGGRGAQCTSDAVCSPGDADAKRATDAAATCRRRQQAAVARVRSILAHFAALPEVERAKARPFVARSPLLRDTLPVSEVAPEYHDLRMSVLYRKTATQWILQAVQRGHLRSGAGGSAFCDPEDPLRALPDTPAIAELLRHSGAQGYVDLAEAAAALGSANAAFMDRAPGGSAEWRTFTAEGRAVLSLHFAARIGDDALAAFLLRRGVPVDEVDHAGRSVLHHFAARGAEPTAAVQDAIAQLTSERRTALSAADALGRTPADAALIHNAPRRDLPEGVVQLHPAAPAAGGGWGGAGGRLGRGDEWWYQDLSCDVDSLNVVGSGEDETAAQWMRGYAAAARPVMMRGILHPDHPVRQLLQRETLLSRFGGVNLSIGSIPYPAAYAGSQPQRQLLRDFVADAAPGEYVFDALDTGDAEATDLRDALRRAAPPPLRRRGMPPESHGVSLQFWMGAAGTGSPFHAHYDAVNYVAHGRKLWLLYPPETGVFSAEPVGQWLRRTAPVRGGPPDGRPGPLRCVQHAGDALYVPFGWAHATVNLEYSVGFAGEQVELEALWPELWPFEKPPPQRQMA